MKNSLKTLINEIVAEIKKIDNVEQGTLAGAIATIESGLEQLKENKDRLQEKYNGAGKTEKDPFAYHPRYEFLILLQPMFKEYAGEYGSFHLMFLAFLEINADKKEVVETYKKFKEINKEIQLLKPKEDYKNEPLVRDIKMAADIFYNTVIVYGGKILQLYEMERDSLNLGAKPDWKADQEKRTKEWDDFHTRSQQQPRPEAPIDPAVQAQMDKNFQDLKDRLEYVKTMVANAKKAKDIKNGGNN